MFFDRIFLGSGILATNGLTPPCYTQIWNKGGLVARNTSDGIFLRLLQGFENYWTSEVFLATNPPPCCKSVDNKGGLVAKIPDPQKIRSKNIIFERFSHF